MPRHEKQSVCKGSAAVPGGLPTRPCSRSILPKQGLLSPRSPQASSPNCSCENNAHSRGLEKIRQRQRVRERVCAFLFPQLQPPLWALNTELVLCVGRRRGRGVTLKWLKTLPPFSPRLTCACAACSKDVASWGLGLWSSTWEVIWGCRAKKGVRVSEETVCEPAVAQCLRPGHQGPVFSSNTLISLQL